MRRWTQALCEQAWTKLQDLEREAGNGLPGIVAALANGHVQAGLGRQRAQSAKAVASRREPITGTSEFPNLKEAAVSVLEIAQIQPAELPAAAGGINVESLPSCRLSEPFEALRDKADALAARPVVFLATLGPIADFAARAGFAKNLFEAGGLAAPSGEGFAACGTTDLAALTEAFKASGARLACLCGSDASYAAEGSGAAEALASAGAAIWLAGRPSESEAALNKAGVTSFIYAGCDVLDALQRAHAIAVA